MHITFTRLKGLSWQRESFDEKTWAAVKEADASRRAKFSKSQYFTSSLPDMFTENNGYHYQCYRRFIAIPKVEIKDDLTSSIPKLHQLRCDVKHTFTSSSGVFEENVLSVTINEDVCQVASWNIWAVVKQIMEKRVFEVRSEYWRMMQC